jgi:hypothetical protein
LPRAAIRPPLGYALGGSHRVGDARALSAAQPILRKFDKCCAASCRMTFSIARVSLTWNASSITAIQDYLLQFHAEAVTLNRVISFRSPDMIRPDNHENRERWIHELEHIRQYRDEGVEGFATWYVRDAMANRYPQLETDAYALAAEKVRQTDDFYGDDDAPLRVVNGYAGSGRTMPSWGQSETGSRSSRLSSRWTYAACREDNAGAADAAHGHAADDAHAASRGRRV